MSKLITSSDFDFKKASNYMRQIFSENDKKNVKFNDNGICEIKNEFIKNYISISCSEKKYK